MHSSILIPLANSFSLKYKNYESLLKVQVLRYDSTYFYNRLYCSNWVY